MEAQTFMMNLIAKHFAHEDWFQQKYMELNDSYSTIAAKKWDEELKELEQPKTLLR